MPVLSSAASKAYVAGARLAPLPKSGVRSAGAVARAGVELLDTEAQALVVGSSLVVAAGAVPRQTREDLVSCTLFAQLAASGKVTDPKKVAEWYAAYFEALTALGFVQHDTRFETFKSRGSKIEAHESMVAVLTDLLGPGAAAVDLVVEALAALRSVSENGPWIALFDRQSSAVDSARFQVATAQLEGTGLVEISLVAFDLESKVSVTQVLFFKFAKKETKLTYASGKATLFEAALGPLREQVAERLQAYRSAYVGAVAFPSAG